MNKGTATGSSTALVKTKPSPPAKPPFADMSWVPGGTFRMGSDHHFPEEAPAHLATVTGFWMDQHAITNAQFSRFVDHTNYVTAAEREPRAPDKHVPQSLVPTSMVFRRTERTVDLCDWSSVPGANWRHPLGPGSSLRGLAKHPVVHIAFDDARAYAQWANKELPTEAEWEFAARGGRDGAEFVWGDEFEPDGQSMANVSKSKFATGSPMLNRSEGTAAVGSFAANGNGLFDMAGNVWEWTCDSYQEPKIIERSCCGYQRPDQVRGYEGNDHASVDYNIIKGGSFRCAPDCNCYRPSARMAQPVNRPTCHLGFRCIVRPL